MGEKQMVKKNLGFIGLGIMGKPMALNLARAGHSLSVFTRSMQKVQEMAGDNVLLCDSPSDVAARSDVVFIMVNDTPDVEQVLFSENGVAAAACVNQIVVDMSTISPTATRTFATRLAEKNIYLLDAPVSGGEQGAINGSLSIMIGGPEDKVNAVMPLLEIMGEQITHIGDSGAGQVTKMCNQIVVAQTITAVAEALTLAKMNEVDPAKVRKALLGGFASSRILDVHGQRMLEHNFQPGFKSVLHDKDMKIALENIQQHKLDLPGSKQAAKNIAELVTQGFSDLDSSSVIKLLEKQFQFTL